MFLFILILIILLLVASKMKGRGEIANKINLYLIGHTREYISDIRDGELVMTPTPRTYDAKKIYSFPFTKYILEPAMLQRIFAELPAFRMKRSNEPYTAPSGAWLPSTFFGEHVSFVVEEYHNFYFSAIIDYFQEECRMLCRRVNRKENFHEFFEQNRVSIARSIRGPITYQKILEKIYSSKYTLCSEFDPVWLTNIIRAIEEKIGSVRRMLDMSAGRGSRMIACAALGVDYTGIDPSECAHRHYPLMKSFAQYCGTKSEINFIRSGFEEPWEAESSLEPFDLMFSSPPYFTLEIYEDTPGQSVNKFSQLEDWLEKFLRVSLEKALKLLRPGGIMAINIDNSQNKTIDMDFVNPMLRFKFPNAEYIGVIRLAYKSNYHTWCWQKK